MVNSSTHLCDCPGGYFLNSDLKCQSCNLEKCQSCTEKEDRCTSCQKEQNRFLRQGFCACKSGFLEDEGSPICLSSKELYGGQMAQAQTAVTAVTAASSAAALPILMMSNPAILIQFLDVLQIIK